MLLDPFEEKLDLPAALVEGADRGCRQGELVGEKHQRLFQFGVLEANAAQMIRIVLAGGVASHSGWQTFATRLNAKGVGMKTIQKLMGHRHIATTALYCDVSDEMLKERRGIGVTIEEVSG